MSLIWKDLRKQATCSSEQVTHEKLKRNHPKITLAYSWSWALPQIFNHPLAWAFIQITLGRDCFLNLAFGFIFASIMLSCFRCEPDWGLVSVQQWTHWQKFQLALSLSVYLSHYICPIDFFKTLWIFDIWRQTVKVIYLAVFINALVAERNPIISLIPRKIFIKCLHDVCSTTLLFPYITLSFIDILFFFLSRQGSF